MQPSIQPVTKTNASTSQDTGNPSSTGSRIHTKGRQLPTKKGQDPQKNVQVY